MCLGTLVPFLCNREFFEISCYIKNPQDGFPSCGSKHSKYKNRLLKSDLSAFSLKLCLDVVSFFLGSALLKNLRSAVYNVLSFL